MVFSESTDTGNSSILLFFLVIPAQQTIIDFLYIGDITSQVITQMHHIQFVAQAAGEEDEFFGAKGRDGHVLGVAAHNPQRVDQPAQESVCLSQAV